MSTEAAFSLPLITHPTAESTVAWRNGQAISRQQFINDVRQLAKMLLPGKHLLNICQDRYYFSVGLAAAMITKKVSLLPSTYTPEVAKQLKAFAPDVFCLTDNAQCTIDMPRMHYPEKLPQDESGNVPYIDPDQLIATVFTSGSTGKPVPHQKTWQSLVECVQIEAKRLGLYGNGNKTPTTIIGTVPPQHMYGFESTVLMPWQSSHVLSADHPFYPADINQAITDAPSPRLLVSTPVHLRALLDADITPPNLTGVVSATAPLSATMAKTIESHCKAPLIEIYGCTETGQIASRRSTQTNQWHLFDHVKLSNIKDNMYAYGGYIKNPTQLNDKIEPINEAHFLLQGRLTDMINIAGKRHSLASLNHLLTTIPGVVDGAFYMPDDFQDEAITRLTAFVVTTTDTDVKAVQTALRKQLDPVFLPRPLLLVDKMPRNSTGKLPQSALRDLYLQYYPIRKQA